VDKFASASERAKEAGFDPEKIRIIRSFMAIKQDQPWIAGIWFIVKKDK
jgi:hypothetical protein